MTENPYIQVLFRQTDEEGNVIPESLWTSKVGDYFRIENIPFYLMDVSFHDIVKAELIEKELLAVEIMVESGHSTIRILFLTDKVEEVQSFLEEQGCRMEISKNRQLMAVDIPPQVQYSPIQDFLEKGENQGFWEYEEGCLAHE